MAWESSIGSEPSDQKRAGVAREGETRKPNLAERLRKANRKAQVRPLGLLGPRTGDLA